MARARLQGVTATHDGNQVVILPGASVTVYYANTTDPIVETMYDDDTGSGVVPNPFTSDEHGSFEFFLDLEDQVKLVITHADAGTLTVDDVQVRAPSGSYVNLDAEQYVKTLKIGLQDGTVSVPSLFFESEAGDDTGWYKSADGEWSFTVNGVRRLTISSAILDTMNRLFIDAGSVSAPAIINRGETGANSGVYFPAEAQVGFSIDGVLRLLVDALGIRSVGVVRVDAGSSSAPAIYNNAEAGANSGLYFPGEAQVAITIDGGTVIFLISSSGIQLSSGVISVPDGSHTAPALTFTLDPDTGPYREGTNSYGIAVGGQKGFIVASDRSAIPGGAPGTLASNMTGPFQYVTGADGTPSGTPANDRSANSQFPFYWDKTNRIGYLHDGTAWRALNPADAAAGALYYASAADVPSALALPTKGYGYLAGASGPIGEPITRKNRLINGDMLVSQRAALGSAVTGADNTYQGCDRWKTVTGITAGSQPLLAQNISFINYYFTFQSQGGTGKFGIFQHIEHRNCIDLPGNSVSLQFVCSSDSSIGEVRAAILYQTSTIDSLTGDPVTTWGSSNAGVTTWNSWTLAGSTTITPSGTPTTYKLENVSIPSNATNVAVMLWCDDTTTTNGHQLFFRRIQLERGAICTEYQTETFNDILMDCYRYYWRKNNAGVADIFAFGQSYNTTQTIYQLGHPTPMRTAGTLSYSALADFWVSTAGFGVANPTVLQLYAATAQHLQSITTTVAAGQVAGDATMLLAATTSAWLALSAEI